MFSGPINRGNGGTEDLYMIVAIDLGTTYSGVCWTWSEELNTVSTIQSWRNTSRSDKVPSRIQYSAAQPCAWGFGLEDSESTFEWFKLLLDYEELTFETRNSHRVKEVYRKMKAWADTYHDGDALKAAVQVTSDYIRLLWWEALEIIGGQLGHGWLRNMSCKVMISRPAIWSQRASERTEFAARNAIHHGSSPANGVRVTSLTMITEPEAAAQAMLRSKTITLRPELAQLGEDIYVVCDAGGGTVDVISYTLQSLNPLRLSECVAGKGDLCGAVFIDDAFERDIKVRIGGDQNWATLGKYHIQRLMDDQWEIGIKKRFDPADSGRDYWIHVPGFKSHRYEPGHLKGLFQPACSKARALIQQQITQIQREQQGRLPKAIILVGGMGASKYLIHLLNEQYKGKIDVRHSADDSWAAVCRGAVLSMVEKEATVVSRISRLHYGFPYDAIYDTRDDAHAQGRYRYWDHHGQQHFVEGKMVWLVNKGENIAQISPKHRPFRHYIEFREEMQYNCVAISIHVCEENRAPAWQDLSVRELCKIIVKLDRDFAALETYVTPRNAKYRVIDMDVVMYPKGNALEFAIYFEKRRLEHTIQWPGGTSSGHSVSIDMDEVADETGPRK